MAFTMSVIDAFSPGTIIRGLVTGRALNAWFMIKEIEIIEHTGEFDVRSIFLGVATSMSGIKKMVNVIVTAADITIEPVYTGDE